MGTFYGSSINLPCFSSSEQTNDRPSITTLLLNQTRAQFSKSIQFSLEPRKSLVDDLSLFNPKAPHRMPSTPFPRNPCRHLKVTFRSRCMCGDQKRGPDQRGQGKWMRNVDGSKAQSYPSIRDFRTESGTESRLLWNPKGKGIRVRNPRSFRR